MIPDLAPRAARVLALLVCVALGGSCDALGLPSSTPPAGRAAMVGEVPTFAHALFDDGNAEVASYRVIERRYGALRAGHATLIVVKEAFDAEALVKADGPEPVAHELEVMKLNSVLTVPAGVYTYRQMASVFIERADARPVKLVTSSQEWCGITQKSLSLRGPVGTLHTSSYFGAEGERAYPVTLGARAVLFDALPMWLRTLDLSRPGPRHVLLMPPQMSNRAADPTPVPATLTVGEPREVRVAAGPREAVPVTVEHAGGTDVFHFDRAPPHTLALWERADGGRYELEAVRRAPYWAMNGPEDVGALGPSREAALAAGWVVDPEAVEEQAVEENRTATGDEGEGHPRSAPGPAVEP